MSETKLPLGARVRFREVYERRTVDTAPGFAPVWTRGRIQELYLRRAQEGEGVLTGYRTRSEGFRYFVGAEEGYAWKHLRGVRVALVVFSLYRNAVEVPPDALEVVE